MTITTMTLATGDTVKVHPAAALFPMMSDAELDALAADIAANGVQQPIVWLGNLLLDGRNRVAAVSRIVDEKRREEIAQEWRDGKNCIIYPFLADPYAYVVSANIHRRHLTAAQHRDVIAALLRANPKLSDRAIAKATKRSPTTVGKVRAEAERAGTVSTVDTRTGGDGIAQPAHKPRAAASKHRAASAEASAVDKRIGKDGKARRLPDPAQSRL